ncbi:MAG: hypothetical protein WC699_02420 [Bacteroidales bacterium]|jgi:hypothetical protein
MACITYNFVKPEAFNAFVPEALAEKRHQKAQVLLFIISIAVICLGTYFIYDNNKSDRDQEKE